MIGVSIGRTTYKDTGIPITPHFSLEDARRGSRAASLTVTTHSYDMHQVAAVDGAGCRRGVLQMHGEAESDYIAALTQDYTRAQEQLAGLPGTPRPVFTYPNGAYSELSERVLQALGVQVTVTTEGGANRLVKGRAGNAPAAAPDPCMARHEAGHAPQPHRRCPAGAALTPRPTLPARADRSAAACMGGGRLP